MRYAPQLQFDVAPAIQAEHICLESDEFVLEPQARGGRVGPSLTVESRFRGCRTELALLDGHRLSVRQVRPRGARRHYVLDLRFLETEPRVRRRIAWVCWLAALALLAVAINSQWPAPPFGQWTWLRAGVPGAIGLLLSGACLGVLALYRTHETLVYQSLHGRARLVEVTGNVGCSRSSASFVDELSRRITAARARVQQSRQQLLRDEMREHRRLHEEGVLGGDAYEESKRRILRAHG